MKLNDRLYDVLKWIAILLLPSLATLVAVIFKIWNLPYGNEIAQTITALATFLGAILGISSVQYKKGKK
jgi:hypothetical protein